MKYASLLTILLTGGLRPGNAGMATNAPKPAPSVVAASVIEELPASPGPIVVGKKGVVVAGDTLVYTISWGPGARATSYDVSRSVTASNGTWTVVADSQSGAPINRGAVLLPNTFSYTRPTLSHRMWLAAIPWDSATFTVTIASRNAVGVSAAVSASWKVSRKPGVPGPITVDSALLIVGVRILPDSIRVVPGSLVQFCGLVRFANGVYVLRTKEAVAPACVTAYQQTIPVAQRLVSAGQQARADSVCLLWRTTDPTGFIEPESCVGNPALLRQRGLLFTTTVIAGR